MDCTNREEVTIVPRNEIIKSNSLKKWAANSFPALAYKDFRYFLFGQCISFMGTWIQKTAQQWVVYELTKSAVIVGLVGVFQFTPMLVFSLFAGVIVDRFPKKKFLLVTQSLQMMQAFLLAILLFSGHMRYWHILILAAFLGVANTFELPARQTFFVDLVGKEAVVSAIGLNSTVSNIGRILGPAIAAIILSYFGAGVCFFANGISFIATLISLVKISKEDTKVNSKTTSIIKNIKDGVRYVFSVDILINAITFMLIVGTIVMNMDVILPVLVSDVLHQQVRGYSLMVSAMGIGSLIGSVLFAANRNSNIDSTMIFKYGIYLSLSLIITSFSHNYFFSLISIAVIGGLSIVFMSSINSVIQLSSSTEYRARAVSINNLVLVGTTPIGNFFSGIVTEHLGGDKALLINGSVSGILVILVFLKIYIKKKKIRRMD